VVRAALRMGGNLFFHSHSMSVLQTWFAKGITMTMSTVQGEIWKQITQTYLQWDPDKSQLMPVEELSDMLPALSPDLIGETLVQAASDRLAELASGENGSCFKPVLQ
jgi:hypothetical protein